MNSWCFVAPACLAIEGSPNLGLFARVRLQAGQWSTPRPRAKPCMYTARRARLALLPVRTPLIRLHACVSHPPSVSEYGGPRLPIRLQSIGSYVLQIPGTTVVIDGASENSPFSCPKTPAIYANHSASPNARIEQWPELRVAIGDVRERMMLVALEEIPAGGEIRINYDDGLAANREGYWRGVAPPETSWRHRKITPPPPTGDEPVINRLSQLRAAAASGRPVPVCPEIQVLSEGHVLPWSGEAGGDMRLRTLVPMLAQGAGSMHWAMISTHLPGRSGRECRERWQQLFLAPVKHSAGSSSISSSSYGSSGKVGGGIGNGSSSGICRGDDSSECCAISGCKAQLLRCHGVKEAGSAIGCAEEGHLLCAPCLERWFVAQNELRAERGLTALTRRTCPVCQCTLRNGGSETRSNTDKYHLGLVKLEWSWS